jgi:hypothetical protein
MLKGFLEGFKSLVGAVGSSRQAKRPDFEENRKLVRLRCHYEVRAECEGKKGKFDATIIDMGLKGLKVRCLQQLKVDQIVKIWTPLPIVGASSEPVECKVVWTRQPDQNFLIFSGMVYVSDAKIMKNSWVKYFLKELGFKSETIYSKRKHIRADCFLDGTFKATSMDKARPMRVYNLGVGGILMEYHNSLPLGEDVQVEIGPLDQMIPFRAKGKLVKAIPDGKTFMYGIEFTEIKSPDLKTLGGYLKHMLKAHWTE